MLAATPAAFDVLLCDRRMVPVDGIAVVRSLGAAHRHLGVVLMTGGLDSEDLLLAPDGRAIRVLAKPFTLAELSAVVARALARRSVAAGH